jgi:hypothetical protein
MKAFSVASWNVEHFKQDQERIERVISFMNDQTPDVFAIYEVQGSEVFQTLVIQMQDYTFHITEGPQAQEILLGVRHGLTAFFTQKLEFKAGVSVLRPGALLTLTIDGVHYPLLFLHTASGNDPRGLGLRDDMLVRACEFRKVLDKASGTGNPANYIFLGDFNTMGMEYRYVKDKDISTDDELLKLSKQAKHYKMRFLEKDAPATWSNGSKSKTPPSNLDHVIAASHLKFKLFDRAEVSVRGWPKESTALKQDNWIRDFSDHGLLYFEVQKVS